MDRPPGSATIRNAVAALSRRNARLVAARKLARDAAARAEKGLFLVEGPKLVREAAEAGVALREVFVSPELALRPGSEELRKLLESKGTVLEVDDDTLEDLATVEAPQGIVAVAEVPKRGGPESLLTAEGDLFLASTVQDPGNAGALARSAGAFGMAGVVADRATADFFSPKSVRGSAGAVLRVPVHRVDDLGDYAAKLKAAGVMTYAAVTRDGEDPATFELPKRVAILLGGEGRGVPEALFHACEGTLTIPMSAGTESLNVAAAAAVLAYAVACRRKTTS